jgi:predicted negative regulator of RcsB-dependent stress response
MDVISGLKYALVLVLIVSAILLGWTTYLERKINSKIEAFSSAIGQAKNEAQAKEVIKNFLIDTKKFNPALSASADSQSCSWLCD